MSTQPVDPTEQAQAILFQLIETSPMPHQGPGLSYATCQQALAHLVQKATIFDAIQSSRPEAPVESSEADADPSVDALETTKRHRTTTKA